MNKARIIRVLLSVIAGAIIAAAIAWVQVKDAPMPPARERVVAGTKIGGPYTLTDHTGKTVTEKDFSDTYKVIYFGFTYCPAICPTELQKMMVALGQAGPAAEKIRPIFVTVDPERDTVPVMAAYVAQFSPRLTGLTGTREQVDAALKAYKIYARKVDDPAAGDYTMDHSSYIYLMTPGDQLLGVFGIDSKPADIVKAIQTHIDG